MIIDFNAMAAHDCKYRIAIASKFNKTDFLKDISFTIEELESLEYPFNISIEILSITSGLIDFVVNVPPDKTVKNYVWHIKKTIVNFLNNNNREFSKPLFTSSCAVCTISTEIDIEEYLKYLKTSYGVKKKRLL